MSRLNDLVEEIRAGLKQNSANSKDEVAYMGAMLNDHEFKVNEYNGKGEVVGQICPADNMDNMMANIISSAVNIPTKEASELIAGYEYTNSDAKTMVGISKEFINGYLQTGRKINLGKRENSDFSLYQEELKKGTPMRSMVREEGENGEVVVKQVQVPLDRTYYKLKAKSKKPTWE